MTREEATRALKMLKTECGERAQWVLPLDWGVAFDMAISALSAEPKWNCTANFIAEQLEKFNEMPQDEKIAFIKRFCGIADKETKSAEPSDLISRADAIEAVRESCGGIAHSLTDILSNMTVYKKAKAKLQALPSADAVQVPDWLIEWSKDYVREYMRQLKEEIIKRQGDKSD